MNRPKLPSRMFWEHGEYSDDMYRNSQITRHALKREKVRPIQYYSEIVSLVAPFVENGRPISMVCMGTRNNNERYSFSVQFVGRGLDVFVYSVDISPRSDADFVLDFNKCPEDWENKWDIIFSNSIDHAINPEDTFYEWLRVTKPGGILAIQFEMNVDPSESDPCAFRREDVDVFAGTKNDLFELLLCDSTKNVYVFRKL